MTCLSEIAEGAPFDLAEAIRAIAKHLTLKETPAMQAGEPLDAVLDPRLATILRTAGLDSPQKVRCAPDAHLLSLDGIGAKTVARIRARLSEQPMGLCDGVGSHEQLRFEQLGDNVDAGGEV